jgi:hypothetical protein
VGSIGPAVIVSVNQKCDVALLLVCALVESGKIISGTREERFELISGDRLPIAKIIKRTLVADEILKRALVASGNAIYDGAVGNPPICRHGETFSFSVSDRKKIYVTILIPGKLGAVTRNGSTRPFYYVAQIKLLRHGIKIWLSQAVVWKRIFDLKFSPANFFLAAIFSASRLLREFKTIRSRRKSRRTGEGKFRP